MDKVDIRDLDSAERNAFQEAILEAGGDTIAREQLLKIIQSQTEFLNWAKGTGSGLYPITLSDGSVIEIPSPAKLVEDSASQMEEEDPGDFAALFESKLV